MTININTLLSLPQNQRRQIAEKLWDSLTPNNNAAKEDISTVELLEKRWSDIQANKTTLLTPTELKAKIQAYRSKI